MSQCCTLNGKHSPSRTWLTRWKKVFWLQRLCGVTLEPLRAQNAVIIYASVAGKADHMQLSEESPVSPIALQENKKDLRMIAIFGSQLWKSFKHTLQSNVSSSRTFRGSSNQRGITLKTTWKDLASEWRQFRSLLSTSARIIEGSEFSSSAWPTANVGNGQRGSITPDGRRGRGLETESKNWLTPHGMNGIDRTGKRGAGGEFAKQVTRWDTPKASHSDKGGPNMRDSKGRPQLTNQVCKWATPQSRDHRSPARVNSKTSFKMLNEESANWPTPGATDGSKDRGSWSDPVIQRRVKIGKSIELSMMADKVLIELESQGPSSLPTDARKRGGSITGSDCIRCSLG